MSTQEFLLAQVEVLQKRVEENHELLVTKDNYMELQNDIIKQLEHQIEDLEKDNKELADVIRGLDPTNPILQHLIL